MQIIHGQVELVNPSEAKFANNGRGRGSALRHVRGSARSGFCRSDFSNDPGFDPRRRHQRILPALHAARSGRRGLRIHLRRYLRLPRRLLPRRIRHYRRSLHHEHGRYGRHRRAVGGKAHGASALCSDRNAHLRRADPDRGEYPDQGAPVKRHSLSAVQPRFP